MRRAAASQAASRRSAAHFTFGQRQLKLGVVPLGAVELAASVCYLAVPQTGRTAAAGPQLDRQPPVTSHTRDTVPGLLGDRRQSADRQPTVSRPSADRQPTVSRQSRRQSADRQPTVTRQSADRQLTVSRQSADRQLTVSRPSADRQPTVS